MKSHWPGPRIIFQKSFTAKCAFNRAPLFASPEFGEISCPILLGRVPIKRVCVWMGLGIPIPIPIPLTVDMEYSIFQYLMPPLRPLEPVGRLCKNQLYQSSRLTARTPRTFRTPLHSTPLHFGLGLVWFGFVWFGFGLLLSCPVHHSD